MKLIGLSGYARSGKDEAAKALVADGWTRIAFADALKLLALECDPIVAYRDGATIRRLSEVVFAHGWDGAKELDEVRRFLQKLGAGGRIVVGSHVWTSIVADAINVDGGRFVVTDVRYPNEVAMIRERGGKIVRIKRPCVGPVNDHESETAVDDDWDYRIINDTTIEDLHEAVKCLAFGAIDPGGVTKFDREGFYKNAEISLGAEGMKVRTPMDGFDAGKVQDEGVQV